MSPGPPDFTHDGPGTPATEWLERVEWAQVDELDLAGAGLQRVVVVAAHPDDETLGAGGCIARLTSAGTPVSLVLATAGEGSHPRSPTTTVAQLADRRRLEAEHAWHVLGGDPAAIEHWGLPDGGLAEHEDALVCRLVDLVGDGRDTLLIAPWRRDGHPDHEALGRAASVAAYRTGARLLQYPIWFWHHSRPPEAPWPTFVALALHQSEVARKTRAIAAHASQVQPLSPQAGDERLLGPALLEHFTGPHEVFVTEQPADLALDALHHRHEDPWGTRTRWYEQRRQALVLAALPMRAYRRALDVGCSVGTLTDALAKRCATILAIDQSPTAADAARARLAGQDVEVRVVDVATLWPEGTYDLIVISESGYFLSPATLDTVISEVARTLTPDGTLLLAHWRHDIVGWPLSGADVHRQFAAHPAIPVVSCRYEDRDVEIVVHSSAAALPDPGH